MCQYCKYYNKINQHCGYCTLWSEQMKAKESCEDWEE